MDRSWILGFVVLLGLLEIGSAIMCYECNSALNSMCTENKLPDSLKRNCSEHDRGEIKHTLCRKITQHVDTQVNGQWVSSRVIRSCGWDDTKYKGACYHRSGFGSRHEVCSCHANYCNGAATISSLLSFSVAALGATVLM